MSLTRAALNHQPSSVYEDGRYLDRNPGWHTEHSWWKAKQVLKMIRRHRLQPMSVCEIGCGAGQILATLQKQMAADCTFTGFDISPQALEMAAAVANERLQFYRIGSCADKFERHFDLMLVIDVIEHVEDYLAFLRTLRTKADLKIFHVPLDLSAQSVGRARGLLDRREAHAHIHYFTKETAIQSLEDAGYEILDWFYTPRSMDLASGVVQHLIKVPRRLGFMLAPDFTVRVLGGFSLAVLAK